MTTESADIVPVTETTPEPEAPAQQAIPSATLAKYLMRKQFEVEQLRNAADAIARELEAQVNTLLNTENTPNG